MVFAVREDNKIPGVWAPPRSKSGIFIGRDGHFTTILI